MRSARLNDVKIENISRIHGVFWRFYLEETAQRGEEKKQPPPSPPPKKKAAKKKKKKKKKRERRKRRAVYPCRNLNRVFLQKTTTTKSSVNYNHLRKKYSGLRIIRRRLLWSDNDKSITSHNMLVLAWRCSQGGSLLILVTVTLICQQRLNKVPAKRPQ